MRKVPGRDYPADICTKGLNAELMTKHMSAVVGRYSAGRPAFWPRGFGVLGSSEQCAQLESACRISQPFARFGEIQPV